MSTAGKKYPKKTVIFKLPQPWWTFFEMFKKKHHYKSLRAIFFNGALKMICKDDPQFGSAANKLIKKLAQEDIET